MTKWKWTTLAITAFAAQAMIGHGDETPDVPEAAAAETPVAPGDVRTTVEEARRQAEVLHDAMHATLQTVHHELYREDEGLPLPAAILSDVFEQLEQERRIKLRWLVVEGQAMNTEHEARDPFEREAVKVLTAGKVAHEQVANGVYRRAGAITLTNQCLKCHVPDRKSTENRTAGLIVSIPVAGR